MCGGRGGAGGDDRLRPGPAASLIPVAAPPAYRPVADVFDLRWPPSADPYSSYHLSSLDEIDLYTERGGAGPGGRQTPSRPPSRDARAGWVLKAHGGGGGGGVKGQGWGLGCT